ncbi:MAG: glycoside hydrolase [Anaerolineales bacterium]|nr:glycoside hydrolase [Anaerolineales bacterium]
MKLKRFIYLALVIPLVLVGGCSVDTPGVPPSTTEVVFPTAEPTEVVVEPEPGPLVIEDGKLYVAIIWHQHQPVYFKDSETGIYEKPWVRVHATKDYLDMAMTVEVYPDVRATFNLTPSLILQLEDFSDGAKDLYWVKAEIPAEELSDNDKRFILERFFDTNPRVIARFPRYQALADLRAAQGIEGSLTSWTGTDYRDLQVLFNLAWTDPDFLEDEPLASLVAKGRDFTEEDKTIIFDEHLRIVGEVLQYHKHLQDAGNIEVTTTPFAHPILPLLVNSNVAQVSFAGVDLPSQFAYEQDAVAQVDMAIELYEEHFGQKPTGMWPAEGSVSQRIINMIDNAGIEWIATDEIVLEKSLPDFETFTRDSADTVQQADELYQPYSVRGSRGGPVAIIFRDHLISDKIGFEYSGTDGLEAAEDLMERLENIKAQLEAVGAEGPNLVTILLDGENAWEHYDNDGKKFLHSMYRLISESEDIVSVTPSEYLTALENAEIELNKISTLWPGSWIDGTFGTWIGEEEENQAWEYLKATRDDLEEAQTDLDEETLHEAFLNMFYAEGSDWFWWYGSDQNSGSDDSFDRQFRNYLERVYLLIGREVPSFVNVPVIPQNPQPPAQQPLDILEVIVDGIASEGEWENAGMYILKDDKISDFRYGFDLETLFLNVEALNGYSDDFTLGFYMKLPESSPTNAFSRYGEDETMFGFSANRLIEMTFENGQPEVGVYKSDGKGGWIDYDEQAQSSVMVASVDNTLELAVPFSAFAPDARSGDRINLRLVVSKGEVDVDIFPDEGPALLVIPDLPIPNVFMTLEDPPNDDIGPGTYTYPLDTVFRPGVFDMLGFTAGYDDEDLIFRVQFRGPVINEWGSPNGLSIQTIDLYIDVDGPENGDRMLLPGRNAALTEDFGWDYAVWAEGWTPGVYTPGTQGPVQIDSGFTIVTNPGKQRVTIRVPRNLIPGDPSTWSYTVAIGSQEGYPSAGVWRLRDVLPVAEQWRIGGGLVDTNHTRLIDILVPIDFELSQEELLSDYVSSQENVDDLSPDEFPQIVMVSP